MSNDINQKLNLKGKFYFKHYREGKLICEESFDNLFMNESLVYALNSAFGVSVGGAPTPYSNLYIGLSQENRTWQATDAAATVNTVANEMQIYSPATRPAWAPVALSDIGSIMLSSSGAEALFTIGDLSGTGGQTTVYGAFLISSNTKDGSGDALATLIAGNNFGASRILFSNDEFRVGYTLTASSV